MAWFVASLRWILRSAALPLFVVRAFDGFNPSLFLFSLYGCGLIGARVFGAAEHAIAGSHGGQHGYVHAGSLSLEGPMSYFGGLCFGLLAAWPFVMGQRRLRLPVLLDAAIPACVLGLAVGRIGCLLNGDDYGLVASAVPPGSLGWGSSWMPVMAGSGPGPWPRYATQLEESIVSFVLVALSAVTLKWVYDRGLKVWTMGCVGALCGALSCWHRVWNESYREAQRVVVWGSAVSPWQIVAFGLGALFLCYFLRRCFFCRHHAEAKS
jgi:prolipoprotein diacylglyceryltransferase